MPWVLWGPACFEGLWTPGALGTLGPRVLSAARVSRVVWGLWWLVGLLGPLGIMGYWGTLDPERSELLGALGPWRL